MAGSQQLNPQEVMTIQLAVLRQEHRDLDLAISALVDRAGDQLAVKTPETEKTPPQG
jgi:hypothetical protein